MTAAVLRDPLTGDMSLEGMGGWVGVGVRTWGWVEGRTLGLLR